MRTHAQKVRFAIFIIITTLTLIGLLAVVTSQRFLKKKDVYYIAYENVSVSGLEIGSPVKYLGLRIGTVEDIRIDPEHVNRIILKVAVNSGTPIKADSRADLVNVGITGLKMVEIRGGTEKSPLLKPGEYIPAGTSITEQITGKAEVIANKIELLLNNLNAFTANGKLDRLLVMADNVSRTFENINGVVTENRANLAATLKWTNRVGSKLDSVADRLNQTVVAINEIVAGDTLQEILSSAQEISRKLKEANILQLIDGLGELVERTNSILSRVDYDLARGSESFNRSMSKLDEALTNLMETSELINQDPSILIRGMKFKNAPDKILEK